MEVEKKKKKAIENKFNRYVENDLNSQIEASKRRFGV